MQGETRLSANPAALKLKKSVCKSRRPKTKKELTVKGQLSEYLW
jgi:hypothetical protein